MRRGRLCRRLAPARPWSEAGVTPPTPLGPLSRRLVPATLAHLNGNHLGLVRSPSDPEIPPSNTQN
jgi:hypothetical protein